MVNMTASASSHTQEIVIEAIEILLDSFEESLNTARDKVLSRYKGGKILPVQRKGPDQEYWFRAQVVTLGKYNHYWANLDGFRDWVRFRIEDETRVLDLVVVGHLVRDPSQAVIVAYVEKRRPSEKSLKLTPYPVEQPFWLNADDDEAVQEEKFKEWKKRATANALSYWENDVPKLELDDDRNESTEPGDLDEYLMAD